MSEEIKIKVKYSVAFEEGETTYELCDVGCDTIEEWEQLSEEEKNKRLQELVDYEPKAAFILDSYETE
jgi:hypothetical protein